MDSVTARSSLQSPHWPYLAAAAVLPSFDPLLLGGMGVERPAMTVVLDMLPDSAEPIRAGPARGQWRLRDDVRRRILAQLGTATDLQRAIAANATSLADNPTTRAFQELLSATPDLAGRPLEALLALDQAAVWFSATSLKSGVSRETIRAAIQREKLLEPLRRLVVGFEGRQPDLAALRGYVDTLPSQSGLELLGRGLNRLTFLFRDHPPFVIHGPGGAGKSTLVAKFILDHVDQIQKAMAFVLLDFDRSTLDPTRPDLLLSEVANQLKVQFPAQAATLSRVIELLEMGLQSQEVERLEKSSHFQDSEEARSELSTVMNQITRETGQNLLFVVDTFEVVQRRGPTAVYSILELVARLLSEVRRLRVVLVGRADLQPSQLAQFAPAESIRWQAWPLRGFDPPAGRAYLRERFRRYPTLAPVSDQELDRLCALVRGNPLGLRLVAQVFAREGASGAREALVTAKLDQKISDEQIQGMLHARIVEHLDNRDLQKIADPGLIVRRITVDLIREVLAVPCGINLRQSSAEELFGLLQNEFSLVEVVGSGAVRHRPDVRLIMLNPLRQKLGSRAREIDDLAVQFWSRLPEPAERAEELYHRLWRNDSREELDARWMPEVEEHLQDAWDEFQTVDIGDWPRIWLAERLGRDLPQEIRARANQVVWERDAERKARALLGDGRPQETLSVLSERPRKTWLATSPLRVLEIEALLLNGNPGTALTAIQEGLASEPARYMVFALQLHARTVSAQERLGNIAAATEAATVALEVARATGNPASLFSCGIARCRIARLAKRPLDPEIQTLRNELRELTTNPAVQKALRDSPSLLRDAVAELGSEAPDLIADALERLGFGPGRPRKSTDKVLRSIWLSLQRPGENAETVESSPADPKLPSDAANASALAGLVRDGRLDAGQLSKIAGIYSSISKQLTNQVLKR